MMNRILKQSSLILLLLILCRCQSIESSIKLVQIESHLPITLRLNKKNKKLRVIQFPIQFKVSNSSFVNKSFSSSKYMYNNLRGGTALLYKQNNKKLYRISKYKQKLIVPFTNEKYVTYSAHFVEDSIFLQQLFKSYIDKMKASNQDTLAVGTLQEFKSKHPELVKNLLDKDTLRLHFDELESKGGGWSYIKLPIQF